MTTEIKATMTRSTGTLVVEIWDDTREPEGPSLWKEVYGQPEHETVVEAERWVKRAIALKITAKESTYRIIRKIKTMRFETMEHIILVDIRDEG